MVSSKARTVADYLRELPADRRKTIAAVRAVVRKHLPKGYVESMNWGMISYEIPLSTFPDTYNGQPLSYAALASQKNFCTLYMMGVYAAPKQLAALKEAFKREGKKVDMGKSCIHFREPDDLPLAAIGRLIASATPEAYIATFVASRKR